jgi:hypothetical protein
MRTITLALVVFSGIAGCGAGPDRGAEEPSLASQAQPISIEAPQAGQLASACDRSVFAFRPTERGNYRFEAVTDVPMSLRLFAMSPDLYLDTGTTDTSGARLEASLDAGESYAVTLAGTACEPTSFTVRVARAD